MEQQLNKMCLDCPHLDKLCDGSHDNIYSGCIWKTADAESLERFLRQVGGMKLSDNKSRQS